MVVEQSYLEVVEEEMIDHREEGHENLHRAVSLAQQLDFHWQQLSMTDVELVVALMILEIDVQYENLKE